MDVGPVYETQPNPTHHQQESCAITKMIVRYDLYLSALKDLRLPDYAHGYFSQIVLMHFCSDRLYECAQKI